MIVLSVMLRGTSIITLRVSLARMRTLLLDEDSFEGGTRAPICNHDLLSIVQYLWIVNSTRARILLFSQLVLSNLLVSHVTLPFVIDAC